MSPATAKDPRADAKESLPADHSCGMTALVVEMLSDQPAAPTQLALDDQTIGFFLPRQMTPGMSFSPFLAVRTDDYEADVETIPAPRVIDLASILTTKPGVAVAVYTASEFVGWCFAPGLFASMFDLTDAGVVLRQHLRVQLDAALAAARPESRKRIPPPRERTKLQIRPPRGE